MQSIPYAVKSVVRPKKPNKKQWICRGLAPTLATLGYPGFIWFHRDRQLQVISAVENTDEGVGPMYHVSVSRNRKRCSRADAKMVLKHFDMEDADEDNHVPGGVVRNFFKPVADHLSGYECPCKETEPKMVEDKGEFIWRG